MSNLQQGHILVHRSNIADGLKALAISHAKMSELLKDDSYSAGYSAGFDDAILAVAQMVGVGQELRPGRETIAPAAPVKGAMMDSNNGHHISRREHHIRFALLLLTEGLLVSNLTSRLVTDLKLTPAQARDIAAAALRRWGQ